MLSRYGRSLLRLIDTIGADARDTSEVRLQKILVIISTLLMATFGILWGSIYLYFNEFVAASIPLGYAVASYAGLLLFSITRRFHFFRFSQCLLSLLLPFLLMVELGGFVNSSGVILWSLSCPFGALVFAGRRRAIRWFVVYLILVASGVIIDLSVLHTSSRLPDSVVTFFFLMNIGGTSTVAFVLLVYFVGEKDRMHLSLLLAHREQQRTLNKLIQTQHQLIRTEKMASLGRVTAGIAHELKNPLNFINNFSVLSIELVEEIRQNLRSGDGEAARDEIEATLDDLEQNAIKVNAHGKRADSIIHTMMLHAHSVPGAKRPTAINELVREYAGIAHRSAQTEQPDLEIRVDLDLDTGIDPVEVVPQDIGRILLNILENAFEAVYEKCRNVSVESYTPAIHVQTEQNDENILIRIRDNGQGIPDEIRSKIFEPFYTTRPTGKGTGLGLSTAYDLITLGHGGDIEFETEVGVGTEFKITLPRPHSTATPLAVGAKRLDGGISFAAASPTPTGTPFES